MNIPDLLTAARVIGKRAEKALDGEWTTDGGKVVETSDGEFDVCEVLYADSATAAFIAHARTDVPALVAMVEQLAAEVERRDRELSVLYRIIAERTSWKPAVGQLEHIRPGHGPCCTCQTCGYHHDDCVCEHNEIDAEIEAVKASAPRTEDAK